jgi:anti-sigma-K factor RskA
MSGSEHMPATQGCGGDAAAYVLGALDPAEAEAFKRHLQRCAICRDEITALQQVVNALPMAAIHDQAPARLRQHVLRRVREEPRPSPSAPRPRPPGIGAHPKLWRALVLVGAGAAIALAVLAGMDLSRPPGARVIHARVAGVSGSAYVRLSNGRGELIVRHFSPPPAGEVYELWLKRPNRPPAPTSVLFSVTSRGAGEIGLPRKLHGVSEIMVTPEPKGGTPLPTHSPVVVARLT